MPSTRSLQPLRSGLKLSAPALSRFASILVLVLAMVGTISAQTLPSGPFGFVVNSVFNDSSTQGGAAILGLMNFDGNGNVSGPYTLELGSLDGVGEETITGNFTGTYSSKPDGTGTISLSLPAAGVTLTLAMAIANHDLQLVVTGCVGSPCNLSEAVMSGIGAAEFNGAVSPFTEKSLNGSYGFQSTKVAPSPLTTVGVWTFDGAGNLSTSGKVVTPGPTQQSAVQVGATYSVNADGTGTITIPPQTGAAMGQTHVFVITNNHSELLTLQTNRAGDGVLYSIGQLQATAQATASPISLTYAAQKVGTTSAARKVTLKNNLSTALTIQPFTFTGADPNDFGVSTTTCGTSLAEKSSCTISVVFKPTATGARTATLNVTDGANNSPQTVFLTGTGE